MRASIPVVLLTCLACAGEPVDGRLEKALNVDLPPWGTQVQGLEAMYRGALQPYEPECGTGPSYPDMREWRRPGITIAGAEVSRIVFDPGADGLEAVVFEFQRGFGRGADQRELLDHFTQTFGKPLRTGRLYSVWEISDSFVVASKFGVSLVKRTSPLGDFARTSSLD